MDQSHSTPSRLIREARKKQDLTQEDLAKALGLDTSVSVCRWEQGAAPIPAMHLRQLSKVLEIPIQTLLAVLSKHQPKIVEEYQRLEARFGAKPTNRSPEHLDIRTDLRQGLTGLTSQYPRASPQALLEAAVEFYLGLSEQYGLDGNWKPNIGSSHLAHPSEEGASGAAASSKAGGLHPSHRPKRIKAHAS